MVAAKRGDLVVVEVNTRTFGIGIPSSEDDRFYIGVVTNITRDGQVKRWRSAGSDTPADLRCYVGYRRHYVMSATKVDVAAAIAAARAHTYPKSDTTMPYTSLDEVKTALRPCRKATA